MRTIQNNTAAFLQAIKDVLGRPMYGLLTVAVFLSVMLFAIWLPNLSFMADIVTSSSLAPGQKISILGSSLGAIQTNFTFLSRALTVVIALLFAVQISVITYYLKRRIHLQKAAGISGVGMVSGLLGVGCAACGSVILSALFGATATAGFIGVLPLRGQEFGLLSIGILGLSLFLTTRKIQEPLVCAAPPSRG